MMMITSAAINHNKENNLELSSKDLGQNNTNKINSVKFRVSTKISDFHKINLENLDSNLRWQEVEIINPSLIRGLQANKVRICLDSDHRANKATTVSKDRDKDFNNLGNKLAVLKYLIIKVN
jgi:hypothetical protein